MRSERQREATQQKGDGSGADGYAYEGTEMQDAEAAGKHKKESKYARRERRFQRREDVVEVRDVVTGLLGVSGSGSATGTAKAAAAAWSGSADAVMSSPDAAVDAVMSGSADAEADGSPDAAVDAGPGASARRNEKNYNSEAKVNKAQAKPTKSPGQGKDALPTFEQLNASGGTGTGMNGDLLSDDEWVTLDRLHGWLDLCV